MTKYYTIKEAAPLLKIAEITLKRWLSAGKIKGTKIGRKWVVSEETIKTILSEGLSSDNN